MSDTILSSEVKVRLVPDLSAAAFKSKRDKELAMWHCLRSLNVTGSGYIYLDEALEGLTGTFGYSRRNVKMILNKGESQFWERINAKRGCVIKIYGIKIICLLFGTSLLNTARFYDVPADEFTTLMDRRLALWESIHKPKGVKANPISRASIQEYTGVQKRQQIRYDKASKIKRTPCFRIRHEQPRLPNIYHNNQLPGHKGQLPKVRRFLKSFKTDEALGKKCYFGSVVNMLRNKNRDSESYILLRSNKRRIQGRLEWEPINSMVME